MEAVARQFATDEHVMVLRNGWFSYRWTEIFEMGSIPKSHTVLKAVPTPVQGNDKVTHFMPHPIDDVVERIRQERPAVFFAPHVETSTGMVLPDDYIQQVAEAVHSVGGLFVLDCIASGTLWVDMKELGVDVLISAPQKVRRLLLL
jgi:aspartate aminotransferase-like enzyme